MAVHNLNLADENLIDAVIDDAVKQERIPWHATHLDGVQDLATLQAEISTLGKFTKASGFTPCRTMQRIASIPWPVACAVKEIDPNFFKDPVKVGRFLRKHPEYAVTRIVG